MTRSKYFAGVSTRRARQKARAGIVLQDVAVTKNTRSRYHFAVSRILPRLMQARNTEEMDEHFTVWIQEEFDKGTPLNLVADALSGLHHFIPLTRKKLPVAWKTFGIWRKFEVPSRAPPITADLILAMASKHLQEGSFIFGGLILLGFHCFLRTGEMLAIRPCDLLVNDRTGIVTIPKSKSGLRHNMKESIKIEDKKVLLVCQEMISLQRHHGLFKVPFWSQSGTCFRQTFYRCCREFHVEHLQFKCYSIRRGGATADYQCHGSMERTLLRGRWGSTSVARLYLQDGLSQLPYLKAKQTTQALLRQYLPFFSTK